MYSIDVYKRQDHDGIIEEIKKMDIDSMTPLEALTRLSDLKSKIEGKENL